MIIDSVQAKTLGVNTDRLAYLDRFLAKAAVNGLSDSTAICVARKGVEIFHGAYGPASPGGPPLPLDMITEIASSTKPVVATLAMMLQEDGLIDLTDQLDQYYPDFVGEDKDGVCLHHLLTHTSGLDDDLGYDYSDALHGAPGTGKTYHSIRHVIAIAEGKSLAIRHK